MTGPTFFTGAVMGEEFRVVGELPDKVRGYQSYWKQACAAADAAIGKWVKTRQYETNAKASVNATGLRKRFPGYKFAAREGWIYVFKPVEGGVS